MADVDATTHCCGRRARRGCRARDRGVHRLAAQASKNDHARRDLRIIELYVDPSGRGQRIGSGLLARAIDAALKRDCRSVELVSNVHDERVRGLAIPFGFALSGDSLVLLLQKI